MTPRAYLTPTAATRCALVVALAAACAPLAGARTRPVADGALRCNGAISPPVQLALQVGKSTLMRLPEPALYRSIANPAVVQAILLAPDTLYVAGIDIGSTNMIIQGQSGTCGVLDVVVSMDPSALQAALAQALPDEREIRVSAAADTLVLTGTVTDAGVIAQAGELASAFVQRPVQSLPSASKADGADGASRAKPASAAAATGGARVINLLNVSAPQQVMLEVKIAEVSKSLLDKLEVGASLRYAAGSWVGTLLSNFLSGTSHGLFDVRKSNGNQMTVAAEKRDGLVRILAEPTVMAISGQEGSFLAGGKIFIPVAQDSGRISLEEREFGVGLRFTPTVLSGGRINLRVAPEVSEVSREGIGISASGLTAGAVLPLITTRRASTTVQLHDGQSFAIGGLIKNNVTTNLKGLPVLSEVPILGALFRSTDFQQDRTELLFVITAHLVKPLPPNYTLPTDDAIVPGRAELFLGGRMEGQPLSKPAPAQERVVATDERARGFELK